MIIRLMGLFLLFSLITFADDTKFAEKVIIKKSTRMLYLSKNGEIYKKYHITLGQSPQGYKEFEGDMKTPEGCIAMSNDDLEEVWNETENGTPLFIIP